MKTNLFGILKRLVASIAFVPALVALIFGLFPFILIALPDPDVKNTPFEIFSITTASDIWTILSFVIGGIFTLTIFSYTMVMNVLNRSISNYSPRLIPLLLSERHHQIILGVTSGTIIYSLILAIFLAADMPLKFPQFGASLSILFSIGCIVLFIYFVHAVSQSIHINYILKRSYLNTRGNISELLTKKGHLVFEDTRPSFDFVIRNQGCGYLNGVRMEHLAHLAQKNDFQIEVRVLRADFILEDQEYLGVSRKLDEKLEKKVRSCFNIDHDEPLEVTETGFKHLVEVAVKAASPAINDPGTALSAIDYLTQLFIHYLSVEKFNAFKLHGKVLVYIKHGTLDELLHYCFIEMHRYMKDDPILRVRLLQALHKIDLNDAENRLKDEIIVLEEKIQLAK